MFKFEFLNLNFHIWIFKFEFSIFQIFKNLNFQIWIFKFVTIIVFIIVSIIVSIIVTIIVTIIILYTVSRACEYRPILARQSRTIADTRISFPRDRFMQRSCLDFSVL